MRESTDGVIASPAPDSMFVIRDKKTFELESCDTKLSLYTTVKFVQAEPQFKPQFGVRT